MKKLILTAALLLFTGATFAQFQFSVHLGGSLPTGDFGKTQISNEDIYSSVLFNDYGEQGNAGPGFNLGVKGKGSLPVEGLGLIATVDGFYNSLNKDMYKFRERNLNSVYDGGDYRDVAMEIKLPRYINIPVMLGLNYQMDFSDAFGIWVEVAAGLNVRIITDFGTENFEWEGDLWYHIKNEVDYKTSVCFAYQMGLGAMFANRISLGIHYYNLGNKSLTRTESQTSIDDYGGESLFIFPTNDGYQKLKSSMFVLRLGYHF